MTNLTAYLHCALQYQQQAGKGFPEKTGYKQNHESYCLSKTVNK